MSRSEQLRIAAYTGYAAAIAGGTILAVLLDQIPLGVTLGVLIGIAVFVAASRKSKGQGDRPSKDG
jgi:hypothetical protein